MTMTDTPTFAAERWFLTYSGVKLPLQLTEELQPDALRNRNTYFHAGYDTAGRLVQVRKLVYGETELQHDYRWSDDGRLVEATIRQGDDEEPRVLCV